MDTIFALATVQGKSGVAVIRLSGPSAHGAATRLCGTLPPFRMASLRALKDNDGAVLDRALVISFGDKASFTGEDVVEFHVHGSRAVIGSVLRALSKIEGLRQAEPGEFTRRALENGRLDLSEVEGLADLIDAETEAQRRQALRVFSGDLTAQTEAWRRDLIRAAALLEATIDFADEDVPVDVSPEVRDLLAEVTRGLSTQIKGVAAAERIRDGFEVAIVGATNVGKSTLLNRLAGRDAAITSEIAGTTRDVIEVRMDIGGLPVTFLDTAGLRDTTDKVEGIGIQRAIDRARGADLRVFLQEEDEVLDLSPVEGDIVLRPKADQRKVKTGAVSGVTGEGIDELIEAINVHLSECVAGAGIATRERHRHVMVRAMECIESAENLISSGPESTDLAAEELRSAIRSLEALIGRVDIESVLDEIFSSFCLGK
ncbi:tRNA uridine-5-carboxymethylaminomethyl(34) synthesis GTPase MnmE [Sediminimonas qiaohouensis]|uniref:tRNA uridine-5-carboxymethylaminomethyl(34) synthesis GTPase MnmE n=1 Tax=Sediminimonas qiaohouensis TaxID=552061 RepID=UPI000405FF99|nr:tRNA uridine-5-carboxymethylaminomethyl(34) synthesis GTPase MnmE [Sediminimonas qiaohouensis]